MSILNTLIVPEEMKAELRKPFGNVYSTIDEVIVPKDSKLITIGDVCSYNAIIADKNPDIIVFDGKERKNPVNVEMLTVLENYPAERFSIANPAGQITNELWIIVRKCFVVGKAKVFIDGEDDLAAIPFILEAPDGSTLLYGLIDQGIVEVKINENVKSGVSELVSYMEEGL